MPEDLIGMGDEGQYDGGNFPGADESAMAPEDDGLASLQERFGGEEGDGGSGVNPAGQPGGGAGRFGRQVQPTSQPSRPTPPRQSYKDVAKQARNWHDRQRARRMELEELREAKDAWGQQIGGVVQTLQQLAAAQRPGEVEEIPDPITQPVEFQQWVKEQNSAALDAKVAPLLEKLDRITGRYEQAEQQQFQQAEQERVVNETREMLVGSHQQYEREFPDLARGAEDRIGSGLEILSKVFSERLGWGDTGSQIAQRITLAIAQAAEKSGELPAAAVDAFYSGLIEEIGGGIVQMYQQAGYELPHFLELGGGEALAQHQQPSPATREMNRQKQVQERARSVGVARPRQNGRNGGGSPSSRAVEIAADYRRAGQRVNWDEVMRAAKEEAGGNPAVAQQIYRAAQQVA